MSVNGIGTAGYPLTGYTARKMGRSEASKGIYAQEHRGLADPHQRRGIL